MFRPLSAAVLSLSLGLSTLAGAPAHANDQQEIARILAALAVLGIAGAAYNDYRDRKDEDRAKRVEAPKQPTYRTNRGRGRDRGHRADRNRRVLPSHCLREINARYAPSLIYGRHCLQRSGVRTDRLPRTCEVRVRVGQRWASAYGDHCLRNKGWRRARHRD